MSETALSSEYLRRKKRAGLLGWIALAAGVVGIATVVVITVMYAVSAIDGYSGYPVGLAGIVVIVCALVSLVWRAVYRPRVTDSPPVTKQGFRVTMVLSIVLGLLAVGVLFIVWAVASDFIYIAVHCSTTQCG